MLLLVFHFRQSSCWRHSIDDSVIRSNASFGSIRPHAQDELINDEDDDDDELLTSASGIVEPAEAHVAVEQVNDLVQLSDDDDDDDELLTSGIISPVNEVQLTSDAVENVALSANQHLQPDLDDDDDDELLTSEIVDKLW
eukprot:scaffold35017_cov150-Skeletonema_dohrnii-CCMP3373.AAC.2